jgi:hypothetical protein
LAEGWIVTHGAPVKKFAIGFGSEKRFIGIAKRRPVLW